MATKNNTKTSKNSQTKKNEKKSRMVNGKLCTSKEQFEKELKKMTCD